MLIARVDVKYKLKGEMRIGNATKPLVDKRPTKMSGEKK